MTDTPPDQQQLTTATTADWLHAALLGGIQAGKIQPVECYLRHTFTAGPPGSGYQLYTREITMPAGALIVSEIHNTCHPFIVSQGRVNVHTQNGQIEEITAPHQGITTPNTQRILAVLEDTVWTTTHIVPEDQCDPEAIVQSVTIPIQNPLLPAPERKEIDTP
jgi:hypothetical protein